MDFSLRTIGKFSLFVDGDLSCMRPPTQAVLLLRAREASYEALCSAMRDGRTVGDCVLAIERAACMDAGSAGDGVDSFGVLCNGKSRAAPWVAAAWAAADARRKS